MQGEQSEQLNGKKDFFIKNGGVLVSAKGLANCPVRFRSTEPNRGRRVTGHLDETKRDVRIRFKQFLLGAQKGAHKKYNKNNCYISTY